MYSCSRCGLKSVEPFLTAKWRYLAMLNYVVDPRLIKPLVPAETEIDFENGETFLSVVGFLFLDTRLLGLPIPLHRDFEEVNLRSTSGENRRTHGSVAWFLFVNWSHVVQSRSSREDFTAKIMLPSR